jgi:hemerythrin-like metal-binding protein
LQHEAEPAAAAAVGWPEIDALHAEFEQCIAQLQAAGDGTLAAALDRLHAHLQRHFGGEERLMRERAFPVLACHKRDHDMVCEVLAEVRRRHAGGDLEIVRRLADELPRWFEAHVRAHDAALADFLGQREAAARATG